MDEHKTQNLIVFVSGAFNILHPGHLRLFRHAKECGDRLIVGVLSDRIMDGKGKSSRIPQNLRLDVVQSNSWVDEAILIDEEVIKVIERLRPDIVLKGKEHEFALNPEMEVLRQYGGRLLFSSGETAFSSIDLLHKEFYEFDPRLINFPRDFLARHGLQLTHLEGLLRKFSKLNICVIGDLIVDEYITCDPLGMSHEDPTIVVTPIDSTRFIGGAGIVAAHAAGLGAKVHIISVVGDDDAGIFSLKDLKVAGVKNNLLVDNSRPTTLKQRFRCDGKSLLRVSHLHQGAIPAALQKRILSKLENIMEKLNVLVFSDFNYGCLPQDLVNQIIIKAKKCNVLIAADSQASSQIGDISRFREMDLITPTEREARISTRNHEDGLVVLAEELRKQSLADNILLKLGAEGLLIHAGNGKGDGWLTDRLRALNSAPRDLAGAGDSLLIVSAMTLASGGNIWEAACLGSLAAAVQVGRVGNTPLQAKELLQEITR